jgi:DNA helicase-2/ATP-dependent DNA helicase PcrA
MMKLSERSMQIVEALNEVQKEAALYDKGPMVVFAGAGSGKTRIITSRIALLIEKGIRPSQIFAVTFTNKASKEMRERAVGMCPDAAGVHIATFHSACARWLREFAPELGFSSDFTIFDDNDVKSLVKRILKEMGVKLDGKYTANDYKGAIAKVKTYGWLPSEAEKQSKNYADIFPPHGAKLYKKYQESLALQNAMDFSDLLLNMLLLLRTNTGVRKLLQHRYKYILVDEYQDTNPTQF